MAKIIGAFVFKDDGDGCLTAKWLNNDETTTYPEASKLIGVEHPKEKFVGNYTTTWIEQGNQQRHSQLEITNPYPGIYQLKWTKDNKVIFHGTAMLYNDILVGSYWE